MSNKVRFEEVMHEEAGARLDRWVKRRLPVTQGQVEKMLRTGQIRIDGARAKSNTRLEAGQSVRLPPVQKPMPKSDWGKTIGRAGAQDEKFLRDLILYEDDDMFALNKPAGLAVQGGTGTSRHLDGMLGALATNDYRPRLVHRLDRDTSGVLIVARHPNAAARLAELFKHRDMQKVYWAVTVGVPNPPAGQLRSWMIKGTAPGEERERMQAARHGESGARHAVTNYVTVSTAGQKAAWVAMKPETGRMHQLRFHMQELGTSILGDTKYMTRREVPQGVGKGLHLHARGLVIPRRGRKPLMITAPLSGHIAASFEAFGFHESEAGHDMLELFI